MGRVKAWATETIYVICGALSECVYLYRFVFGAVPWSNVHGDCGDTCLKSSPNLRSTKSMTKLHRSASIASCSGSLQELQQKYTIQSL